jgi:hypothetical protein
VISSEQNQRAKEVRYEARPLLGINDLYLMSIEKIVINFLTK